MVVALLIYWFVTSCVAVFIVMGIWNNVLAEKERRGGSTLGFYCGAAAFVVSAPVFIPAFVVRCIAKWG